MIRLDAAKVSILSLNAAESMAFTWSRQARYTLDHLPLPGHFGVQRGKYGH